MASKKTSIITAAKAHGMIQRLASAIHDSRKADVQIVFDGIEYHGVYSEALDATVREVCDQTLSMEVEPEAYRAVMYIERLAHAYAIWLHKVSVGAGKPSGSPEVNKSMNEIIAFAAQVIRYDLPESVERLRKRGVSDMQIARIYGWYNEMGDPDIGKVFEEAASPGTHFNPDTWMHPAKAAEIRDATEAWTSHHRSTARLSEPIADEAPSIPTVEEFIKAKAPSAQILRAYPELNEDDLREMAELMGVKLDERSIVPANPLVGAREKAELTEAKLAELNAQLTVP